MYQTLNEIMVMCRGNISMAAKMLGINRGTLRKHLERKTDLIIKKEDDGTYRPYIAMTERSSGYHKKG